MPSEDCISAGDGITAAENGGTVGPSTEDCTEKPIAGVYIRDEKEFQRKRQRIVEGGTEQLQVMAGSSVPLFKLCRTTHNVVQ